MRVIDDLLREANEAGASDIHVTVGRPPFFRVDGALQAIGSENITKEEAGQMIEDLIATNQNARGDLEQKRQADFSYALSNGPRFRVNVFYHVGEPAAALRLIPTKIRTIEELHLPPQIQYFSELKQGFVLCVGPAGHGKSTTLAALVDHINQVRKEHIITIEDPIEYLFTDKDKYY